MRKLAWLYKPSTRDHHLRWFTIVNNPSLFFHHQHIKLRGSFSHYVQLRVEIEKYRTKKKTKKRKIPSKRIDRSEGEKSQSLLSYPACWCVPSLDVMSYSFFLLLCYRDKQVLSSPSSPWQRARLIIILLSHPNVKLLSVGLHTASTHI